MLAFVFVSISGISYAADKVFALVPKAMNNPFFDLARDGCKQAEQEIGGIECLYIGPGEHTEQEQVQIVQDLIAKGVDGIAVASSNAAAMAKAVKDFPMINVSVDGNNIHIHKNVNIGMAAALPDGNLIVPVIKECQNKNLISL